MRLAAYLSTAILAACASGPPIQTASGQPEITLSNIEPSCVRSLMLNLLVDGGYSVRSSNDIQIIAGRQSRNPTANLLLGSGLSPYPEERTTILMIGQQDGAMRLVISDQYVSNPGTGLEHTVPIRHNQTEQNQFLAIRDQLQARCPKQ